MVLAAELAAQLASRPERLENVRLDLDAGRDHAIRLLASEYQMRQ
jgi:hypothetical protein